MSKESHKDALQHLETIEQNITAEQLNDDNQLFILHSFLNAHTGDQSLGILNHASRNMVLNALVAFFKENPRLFVMFMSIANSPEFRKEMLPIIQNDMKGVLSSLAEKDNE
jgi:hypothetical protein